MCSLSDCKCHGCVLGYVNFWLRLFYYQPSQCWSNPCYDKCHLLKSRAAATETSQNTNPGIHHAGAIGQMHETRSVKFSLKVPLKGESEGSYISSCWGHHTHQFPAWGAFKELFVLKCAKNNVVKSTHMTAGSRATCQGAAPDCLPSQLSSNFTRLQWLKISYRSGFRLFTCCFLSCSHVTCIPAYDPKRFTDTCVIHTETLKSNSPVVLLST